MRLRYLAVAAMAVAALVQTAMGTEWHVPSEVPTIQEAIDLAAAGDVVVVDDGVWTGTGNMDLDFKGKAIKVKSLNGPAGCTIECEGNGRAVTFQNAETNESILEGFTIKDGVAEKGGGMYFKSQVFATVVSCILVDCLTSTNVSGYGAAVCIEGNSGPSFVDCAFQNNEAQSGGTGGGIYSADSSPTFTNCTINGNEATTGAGFFTEGGNPEFIGCEISYNGVESGGHGGYIVADLADPSENIVVSNCAFIGNANYGIACSGESHPDAVPEITDCSISASADSGIGMWDQVDVTVKDCTISGNSTGRRGKGTTDLGGGIFIGQDCSPMIINTIITDNEAFEGGGVYSEDALDPVIVDCIIADNTADFDGGAVYCDGVLTIANCTITGNSGDDGSISMWGGELTIDNSILWNNPPHEIYIWSGSVDVSYSCVEGGYTGVGNISDDPSFVDAAQGDYRLDAGSPCIDAADNAAVPADEADLDQDGDTDEPIPFDAGGQSRFVDDPDTTDTGNGDAPIVDMGAFEFQIAADCPEDVNGDEVVDIDDLFAVLGNWGPCDDCPEDVDESGEVNIDDVFAILGNWGPCS